MYFMYNILFLYFIYNVFEINSLKYKKPVKFLESALRYLTLFYCNFYKQRIQYKQYFKQQTSYGSVVNQINYIKKPY